MALKKATSPSATEPTAETDAATDQSPSALESSSDQAATEPTPPGTPIEPPPAEGELALVMPGEQPDSGPLVPVAPEPEAALHEMAPGPDDVPRPDAYVPGTFNLNAAGSADILTAPAPIQNDLTPAALEDYPARPDSVPEGHIIWPGETLTVEGFMRGGALVTKCRHYEAKLVNGSSKRWTFVLLYPAGVEIHDRKLVGRLLEANQLRVPAGA